MELSSTLGLAVVCLLVIANGFFVATEFAIVAVRRSRLAQLAQEGRPGAAAAQNVVTHLDTYIAATQFGITLASLALGWIGEPALAHLLEPALTLLVAGVAPMAAHGIAIAAAFAAITGLHIVIGELAPKGLALQRPESTSLWVARPIQLFHALFKWPITALNAIGNRSLRLIGLQATSGLEMVHSVEELRMLVTGMQEAGVVDVAEARIARRAFAFGDLTVAALMTPRTEMQAVPVTATLEELLQMAETSRHSQLPVYEGTLDNVIGILHLRELFKHRNTSSHAFALKPLIRAPLVVPDTKYAAELLEDMRSNRCHIAILVDEYGGTAGMATLKDLLEALVGRIDDAVPATDGITREGGVEADGSVLLDGLMRVEEFEETAGLHVEESHEGVETLGGLITATLGRIPEVGEQIAIGGRTVRVEGRDGRRIATVRLLPLATAAEQNKATRDRSGSS
jgi:magnesium and cobalt exporter, CNNM family